VAEAMGKVIKHFKWKGPVGVSVTRAAMRVLGRGAIIYLLFLLLLLLLLLTLLNSSSSSSSSFSSSSASSSSAAFSSASPSHPPSHHVLPLLLLIHSSPQPEPFVTSRIEESQRIAHKYRKCSRQAGKWRGVLPLVVGNQATPKTLEGMMPDSRGKVCTMIHSEVGRCSFTQG
jgi:hypothetical protein